MALFAKRYASALADVVAETGADAARAASELADFAAAWHQSSDLREVLSDPSLPVEQKVRILDALNGRMHLSGMIRNFLAVLISHNRIEHFDEVFEETRSELRRRQGIHEAVIISARPLGEEQRRELEGEIARLAGGRVEASFEEDGSLLGGVVVRLGSTVYDGSVRGRLARLRATLTAD